MSARQDRRYGSKPKLIVYMASGSWMPLPLTPWADVKAFRNLDESMGVGESSLAPP